MSSYKRQAYKNKYTYSSCNNQLKKAIKLRKYVHPLIIKQYCIGVQYTFLSHLLSCHSGYILKQLTSYWTLSVLVYYHYDTQQTSVKTRRKKCHLLDSITVCHLDCLLISQSQIYYTALCFIIITSLTTNIILYESKCEEFSTKFALFFERTFCAHNARLPHVQYDKLPEINFLVSNEHLINCRVFKKLVFNHIIHCLQ